MAINFKKFLGPIVTGLIKAQMTSRIPGLAKRDKVVRIALDMLDTVDEVDGDGAEDRIDEDVARDILTRANDLVYQGQQLRNQGQALINQGMDLLDEAKRIRR